MRIIYYSVFSIELQNSDHLRNVTGTGKERTGGIGYDAWGEPMQSGGGSEKRSSRAATERVGMIFGAGKDPKAKRRSFTPEEDRGRNSQPAEITRDILVMIWCSGVALRLTPT
jgi:hypothetical protein